MNSQPQVSVLLPFYNAQDTLARSAGSILAQAYADFELILIDNASNDSSPQIARQIAAADARVRIVSESRRGVVHATERGYGISSGTFISRMDADDFAYPDKLHAQVGMLQSCPQLGGVSCLVENVADERLHGGGMEQYVQWTNTRISADEISVSRFVESPIINPTILLRRTVIQQNGLYRSGDYPEDYELWLRLLQHGVQLAKVPEVLLQWNDSPSRLTRTDGLYSTDAFYRIKSRYVAAYLSPFIAQGKDVLVWGAGRVSRKRASLLEAEGISIRRYIDLKENLPSNVMSYRQLEYSDKNFILVYVANRGAREQIQAFLSQLGYVEGTGFLCMA